MSKINSTKKVILEDFPADVRPWLTKLVDPLNRFLEQAYFALVNGLTLGDNIKSQTNTIVLDASQSYPVKLSWTLNERPTLVLVASIQDTTGAIVQPYGLSWIFNNGQVEITLSGLAANKHKINIVGIV